MSEDRIQASIDEDGGGTGDNKWILLKKTPASAVDQIHELGLMVVLISHSLFLFDVTCKSLILACVCHAGLF